MSARSISAGGKAVGSAGLARTCLIVIGKTCDEPGWDGHSLCLPALHHKRSGPRRNRASDRPFMGNGGSQWLTQTIGKAWSCTSENSAAHTHQAYLTNMVATLI
jgi:hypothetical protein